MTILNLLSSRNKLAVLAQSESVKEHGKEHRPGVATALIRDTIRGYTEASLS
jgi:hypothetical protein